MSTVTTLSVLVSSEAPSNFEDQVTFTATVTGSTFNVAPPSGTVSFYDDGDLIETVTVVPLTPTSNTSRATSDPITILLVGTHDITAIYSGDANYGGSTAIPNPLLQQVNAIPSGAPLLPGFALIASFSASGDSSLPPQATLFAVPQSTHAHTSITLLWDTVNVGQIEIAGNNSVDYQPLGFDSGRISTTGSGVYIVGNGFTKSILLTLTAYDATGSPLGLTSSVQIIIS
jgi:hypothetical protein